MIWVIFHNNDLLVHLYHCCLMFSIKQLSLSLSIHSYLWEITKQKVIPQNKQFWFSIDWTVGIFDSSKNATTFDATITNTFVSTFHQQNKKLSINVSVSKFTDWEKRAQHVNDLFNKNNNTNNNLYYYLSMMRTDSINTKICILSIL